ncbi:MAG: glycosyltransferase family 9 protein [Verrucomicrobiales bacterium]|nr:glycosyltransferase family 9 protein [Verrucomicrobiales bacterium]
MNLPDFSSVASALVIKPSSLGDIVHALPAVHRIKCTFPQVRLSWLVNPEWAPLLRGNPDVAEVVEFPRGKFRGLSGMWRFRSWLGAFRQRPHPDVALDFQGLFRSAFLGRKSGARCVVGLADSREGAGLLHHVRVPVGASMHAVDRYLALAAACGAGEGPLEFPMPEGACPPALAPDAVPVGRFVLLHPFSRGSGKSLRAEQVREFCERMAPERIFLAGKLETGEPLGPLPTNTANLLNQTTLPELCWLMRRAAFTVSVDSGPMHMAAALSSKLVSLHTWSDPRLVGPYPADAWVWKAGKFFQRGATESAIAAARQPFPDSGVAPLVDFVRARLAGD